MRCDGKVWKRFLIIWVLMICSACGGDDKSADKLTKENFLKVTTGMTVDDAKLILGTPSDLDNTNFGNYVEAYYKWEKGGKRIKITFSDKGSPGHLKVVNKEQTGL